jgi:hypothetical protein
MLATSRKKRTRAPFADTSMLSPMFAPLNSSVSLPPWPSTVSLPSPGSHWNVSSPPPSSALSAPWLPSTKSLPRPPISVSAPEPPTSVSSPSPPFRVTTSSVNAPPLWSMRTSSSPPRASTSIAVKAVRSKLKSAVPSAPTSTCSVFGEPGASRSASLSLAASPMIFSVPSCSFGM